MDSFELNKIAGAVLGTLVMVMGLGFVSDLIFTPKKAGDAGYPLPAAEEHAASGAETAAKVEPLPVRLASADVKKGEAAAKQCATCHTFEKGGPNKIGPDLWNIVDRPKASVASFGGYSAANKEHGAKGEKWTLDNLDHFIDNPKGYMPGTAMGFMGLKDPARRADLLAYLNTLSDSPKPLPKPEAAAEAKPADAKPADAKPEGEKKP